MGASRSASGDFSFRRSRCTSRRWIAKRKAFGAECGCVYRIAASQVHATLYSIGDVDVASVAKRFDGGGHRNAAGFTVSLQRWLDEFV